MSRKIAIEPDSLRSQPKSGRSPVTLEPFYYLEHFEFVLAALQVRYPDLLCAEEADFMARFAGMPRGSRALLVRMALRKGDLFRESRLRYTEIGDLGAALAPLIEAAWVEPQPELTLDELQVLLTKPELLRHFSVAPQDKHLTKPALVDTLKARLPGAKSPHAWYGSAEGVYRLQVARLCDRFRSMYFGNFYQDWSDLVLADLGIFAFEHIDAPLQSRAFDSRVDIEDFLTLQRCRQLLADSGDPSAVLAALPCDPFRSDWLEERRQGLLFEIARGLERSGEAASALQLYLTCSHPGARVRAVRLHERAGQYLSAFNLAASALGSPENDAERQQLRRIWPRLNRKLGLTNNLRPAITPIPSFELTMKRPETGSSVEYLARDFLAEQAAEATVHYVENGLVNSLFGLLCWRAIFAPIPGAFFHDFQRGPADLSSGGFCRRRAREFADCFAELDSQRYQTTIRETYARKIGIQAPFVAWHLLTESLLDVALACFPASHLRHFFDWIVHDLHLDGAGFPDLVQFWPDQRRYRMIEIKGPGDRLQDNQRRLLEYCTLRQMPVAVCYVRWT